MRIALQNFTGGEISPTLGARYDLTRYRNCVACMENMLPGLHGDAARRSGTRFVADLGEENAVLIPFSFNEEAGQNFVLILSGHRLRVSDGTALLDVDVVTPYTVADLLRLSYAQVGDVVYLAHPDYPLQKILRTDAEGGGYAWEIEEVVLNQSLDAPAAPTVKFSGTAGSYTLRYKVVAVDDDGRESLPSEAGAVTTGKHPSDWVQGNSATVTWSAVDDATEYNVYREEAGYYGFIGVTKAASAEGGELAGLKMGSLTCDISHYAGSITRTVVNGNGHTANVDSTSKLKVSASTTQNAFILDNKAFVRVTKTTNTTTWRYLNNSNGTKTWLSSTSTSKSYFWAVLPCEDGDPSGTYSTYTTGQLGNNAAYPSGTVGAYAVSPVFAAGATLKFIDNNYEADTSDTPKEDWDPFADGNNPGVVAFHQQRMALGGGKKSPGYFYMSRTGDFENFRKSRPLQDDDPVEYMIASGSIDSIQWIASFGDLLLGTSGSEYKATGTDGVITPSGVSIVAQSYWGSSGGLAPLIIGNSVMHVQRHGSRVRDLFYSLEKDGYAGNDLSIMAPHLFDGYSILQWAYQQTPSSTIWCVRNDGTLLALTYMKEHEIYGWSRHPTDGKVRSVSVLSGEDSDVLLLVVERQVNGVTRHFLEKLEAPFGQDTAIEEAFFVDCGITQRSETGLDVVTGLDHLEGREVSVLADGSPVEGCVVQGGQISLPYPAKVVHAGLAYTAALAPLPVEADAQTGSTLGKRRAYGRCAVRLYRSVGGKYGPDRGTLYDFPFLPATYGAPCEPFSGDLEFTPGGGQDAQTSVWLVQDRPLPWRLLALVVDTAFG